MMGWRCILHRHEIIRYDREFAWQCINCLKKWPMAPELVRASGVYAQKVEPLREYDLNSRKADQKDRGVFQGWQNVGAAMSSRFPTS